MVPPRAGRSAVAADRAGEHDRRAPHAGPAVAHGGRNRERQGPRWPQRTAHVSTASSTRPTPRSSRPAWPRSSCAASWRTRGAARRRPVLMPRRVSRRSPCIPTSCSICAGPIRCLRCSRALRRPRSRRRGVRQRDGDCRRGGPAAVGVRSTWRTAPRGEHPLRRGRDVGRATRRHQRARHGASLGRRRADPRRRALRRRSIRGRAPRRRSTTRNRR